MERKGALRRCHEAEARYYWNAINAMLLLTRVILSSGHLIIGSLHALAVHAPVALRQQRRQPQHQLIVQLVHTLRGDFGAIGGNEVGLANTDTNGLA